MYCIDKHSNIKTKNKKLVRFRSLEFLSGRFKTIKQGLVEPRTQDQQMFFKHGIFSGPRKLLAENLALLLVYSDK